MKKGMIRFLATSMTALTLTGGAVAFAPATQVFASEATSDASDDTTHEVKTIYANDVDTYIMGIVGDKAPSVICDNNRMYRIGNTVYSFTVFDQEPLKVYECFSCQKEAEEYYKDCCRHGMIDRNYDEDYPDHYKVTGRIPIVNLAIATYTVKPIETIKITADRTTIRPGECACLHFDINEGADMSNVRWRAVDAEGVAEFYTCGSDAFLTGYDTGSIMVFAESEDGVKDFIHIHVVN